MSNIKQINNNCQNLICLKVQCTSMDLIKTPTPKNKYDIPRLEREKERAKRFMRKPTAERTERSSSKKSFDTSVKEMYIKSPTSIKKQRNRQADFFTVLAESMISKVPSTQIKSKEGNPIRYLQRSSERCDVEQENNDYFRYQDQIRLQEQQKTAKKNLDAKVKTLQAEIELKNHEISILSGQIQRIKIGFEEQREKRKKYDNQRKELSKQMRQIAKMNDNLKIQIRKFEKEKQHLMKQIQFLQRINFDQKTRNLQSYKEKYLEAQLQKAKKQMHKSKSEKQEELQHIIRRVEEEKFTIQSHYKAMKVANQCLIKQINNTQESIHDIILNSDQYKKLRDKYIRFLEQYKLLRNEYWSLKAESSQKNKVSDSSSLFSITASEVEDDLSLLKNQSSLCIIQQSKTTQKSKTKYQKSKGFAADATYSFQKIQ